MYRIKTFGCFVLKCSKINKITKLHQQTVNKQSAAYISKACLIHLSALRAPQFFAEASTMSTEKFCAELTQKVFLFAIQLTVWAGVPYN